MNPPAIPPPPLPDPDASRTRAADNLALRWSVPVGRSGWAIAAGYLGIFSLLLIPGPIAVIVSIIAIMKIRGSRRTDNPKLGMGRAVFGLILGLFGTGVLVVLGLNAM